MLVIIPTVDSCSKLLNFQEKHSCEVGNKEAKTVRLKKLAYNYVVTLLPFSTQEGGSGNGTRKRYCKLMCVCAFYDMW